MLESDRQRAVHLVATPSNYNRIISEYDSETDAYSALTSAASQTFSKHSEVIELHRIFIENNTQIEQWLTRDLARTIKNKVLADTDADSQFPVGTLQEVVDRLDAYEEIGIDVPTVSEQVETIIEAIYDADWGNAHAIIDRLLDDIPDGYANSMPVYFLARTRAALALHPMTSPGHDGFTESPVIIESRRFKATTAPPEMSAPNTPTECFERAELLPYESDRKRKMFTLAIHKDPSESTALAEYLYLSAKNTVEKYRHRDPNPSRGHLAVAQLQFDLIAHKSLSETSDGDRIPWAESYYHISHGMMYSSARYESTRVNAPEMEFLEAADAYKRAAAAIASVNTRRQLKYLSKSYRHQANATRDIHRFGQIHQAAKQEFFELYEEDVLDGYGTVAQQLIRYHHYRELEMRIYNAFCKGSYGYVNTLYIDYHELANTIPKITNKSSVVELCYSLAQASQAFDRGDTASAQYYLDSVDSQQMDNRFRISDLDLQQHCVVELFTDAVTSACHVQSCITEAKRVVLADTSDLLPTEPRPKDLHLECEVTLRTAKEQLSG